MPSLNAMVPLLILCFLGISPVFSAPTAAESLMKAGICQLLGKDSAGDALRQLRHDNENCLSTNSELYRRLEDALEKCGTLPGIPPATTSVPDRLSPVVINSPGDITNNIQSATVGVLPSTPGGFPPAIVSVPLQAVTGNSGIVTSDIPLVMNGVGVPGTVSVISGGLPPALKTSGGIPPVTAAPGVSSISTGDLANSRGSIPSVSPVGANTLTPSVPGDVGSIIRAPVFAGTNAL